MKAERRFLNQPHSFWAHVRSISQAVGYTERGTQRIKIPTMRQITSALESLELRWDHLADEGMRPTPLGQSLLDYFEYRAAALNDYVRPRLMDVGAAGKLFKKLHARYKPARPIPMNKQSGDKKAPAFFTATINMLIEANSQGLDVDYNPLKLTTVTKDGVPLRTLARRIDGAFPETVNPIAVWEIKEYYYTTTFGSRVADGIYESLLDGMELEELREHEEIAVLHYLMVDGYGTWWDLGRSYLCRIVDILHMGYLDEALFGSEVAERLPEIVAGWVKLARSRGKKARGARPGTVPE